MGIIIIVFTFVTGLFVYLGILFSRGKGDFLIAGYNTMPQKKRNEYDKTAMCKFMGKMNFVFAFIFAVITVGIFLRNILEMKLLFTVGILVFIIVIALMLVYMNTGNRFKKS
jgi:preprotein translocase subunit SecG